MNGPAVEQPSVLALRALGLGDLVTAVPALRGIRRSYPRHHVILATSPALAPLVREMDFVDAMLPSRELEELAVQLEGDDVAVNLHGRGPESTSILLATTPPRLVAFAHPDVPATYGFPAWHRREHEVHRWCRLLTESGLQADPEDIALPRPHRDVGDLAGATVVHPGASARARQWPADRWARVARSLVSAGEQVVVTGSRSEVPLAREIAREAGIAPEAVLAGRTDVGGLAAVIAAARTVLSSDTGAAHLATAYGTPSLTLFGPTPPAYWGPPAGRQHRVIWKGRTGHPNADRPDPGLLAISVHDVLQALERLPRAQSR